MPMYMPERILVAPSGFKESLSAVDVADAIAAGVRRVYPGVRIDRRAPSKYSPPAPTPSPTTRKCRVR